jgi:hypothetical protein
VILYSILAIEITLSWNHVSGVYEVSSTGQFIPLFIGLMGVGKSLVAAFLEHPDVFSWVSLQIRELYREGAYVGVEKDTKGQHKA